MPSPDVLALTGTTQLTRWNVAAPVGTSVVVTYSFSTTQASYDSTARPGFTGFSAAQQSYARQALATWAAVSGISFVEVPEAVGGQIRLGLYDMTGVLNSVGQQASGFAYLPYYSGWTVGGVTTYSPYFNSLGGDVFLNANIYAGNDASMAPGQRGYSILLHELGHAIGFKHPFEGTPTIDPSHDNSSYTVLSYNRPNSTTTLGTVDVEASQYYYGVQDLTTTWDPATLTVTRTGTAASEWVLGTELTDILNGGEGNDTLRGELGNDTIDGGGGRDTAIFSGYYASYTLTNIAGGIRVVGPDGTDTVLNVESFQFVDRTVNVGGSSATPNDFNGDHMSDIVWRNDAGATSIWAMNDATILHSSPLGTIPSNWTLAGTGDFNGDGKSDLLWRNEAAGAAQIWDMNDGAVLHANSLGIIPSNWHALGVGDFNGDGMSDIVWRNDAGATSIWAMNDATILHSSPLGTIPTNWTVAGTGDFNGDGKSDLLWRNEAAGTAQIWDMNDGAILHANSLGIIPAGWHVLGVGDFNGDHMSDIVWRNDAGATSIWAMNDATILHSSPLGTIPTNWTLAGTGDYNGDDKSDLLWRNETASAAQIWAMNDGAVLHANSLGVIPANWHIIA
ncbi:FG-GAP repeat protein [Bradyrhizobium lablabi]|uniref:FG-GAP-like repeat-containing protein n=1 Tax=Bradyrhizobium lablabi TaxID=722472 RepID=UPI001BAC6BF3|nr:FG-GAP-like repeat-containing protein [Bradyrhizobium lablabi]MBR1122037.1 FG-GAP repeat protein [Bradyrhizobium lablabi]